MADDSDVYLINDVLKAGDTQPVLLYTPRSQNLQGISIKRYGILTSLRLNAKIRSLSVVNVVTPDDGASNAELAIYQMELRKQPRKTLKLSVEGFNPYRGVNIVSEVALIPMYPNFPRYIAELIDYFTALDIYAFQYGFKLFAQVIDMADGYGVLSGEDEINIYGSVIEKSNFLIDSGSNTPVDLII